MLKLTQDILPQYKIGKWTYGVPQIKYDNKGGNLEIGSFCSIAGGVQILLGGNHRMDWVTTYPFYVYWNSAKYISSPSHSKSVFNLTHTRTYTGDMGMLIPSCLLEVMPSDSFKISQDQLLRMSPLLAPLS